MFSGFLLRILWIVLSCFLKIQVQPSTPIHQNDLVLIIAEEFR